jgi:copper homeostasis protein
MIIEIIATSLAEAILAQEYGAQRIELIHAFTDGGLSPELELSSIVCQNLTIPVNIMLRPHGRDFVYDIHDMHRIEAELDNLLTNAKLNSIVFGSLTNAGNINYAQLEFILRKLENTQVGLTFHRAIDVSNNPLQEFIHLQNYSGSALNLVLSSGGKATALEGKEILTAMHQQIKQVKLLPGSGITPFNISQLLDGLAVDQIHLGTGVRVNNQLNAELFKLLKSNITANS